MGKGPRPGASTQPRPRLRAARSRGERQLLVFTVTEPKARCPSTLRVIRGGSWLFGADRARSLRYTHAPADRGPVPGARPGPDTSHLPGRELVEKGPDDLARGGRTLESLLVSMGAPRLRRLGFLLESPLPDAERALYDLLAEEGPDAAHSRYNALVRRLVSFERAAECAGR